MHLHGLEAQRIKKPSENKALKKPGAKTKTLKSQMGWKLNSKNRAKTKRLKAKRIGNEFYKTVKTKR
jgi:hypothetical protein